MPSGVGGSGSRRLSGRETSDVEDDGIVLVLACEGGCVTGGGDTRPVCPRIRGIFISGGRIPDRSREVNAVTPNGVGRRG